MAEVTVKVNGRPYQVGCADGQERHVAGLAELVRPACAPRWRPTSAQLGETRLFLLGALMQADELAEARINLAGLSTDLSRAHEGPRPPGAARRQGPWRAPPRRSRPLTAKAG
ncbi:MAG: cell division protein ZapA [Caulobacteraceae bacterium]